MTQRCPLGVVKVGLGLIRVHKNVANFPSGAFKLLTILHMTSGSIPLFI